MRFSARIKGDGYLAYRALIAHPLLKLFRRDDRTGRQRFLANYGPEGLIPLTEGDRRIIRGASRCINCGLCDSQDLALSAIPRTVYQGASLLPVAFSRAAPQFPRLKLILESLRADSLERAEAICPTRVPLQALVNYVRQTAGGMNGGEKPVF